jgi:iron(III) transport system ATP-binding protein
LEFRSVSKSYGQQQALWKVSFTVAAGENLAVLGPSGSGKSTALRLLAGLDSPDAGEVFLGGCLASEPGRIVLPPHRRGLSLVFQDLALWPNLSARDNVSLGLAGLALSRREARARTSEALSRFGIEELADRKPGALSGGQQQRVALARAIAVRPTFLLLDEPYTGLDLVLKSRLLAEVRELAAVQDMTVILVTHDPLEAMALCRWAVVLDQGRLVEAGPFAQLLREPRSDLLRVFRDEFSRHEPEPGRGEEDRASGPAVGQPSWPGRMYVSGCHWVAPG